MIVWISRDQIVTRLKKAGWSYSTETKRVEIFKLKNSSKRMNVPKKDYFPELAVRLILKTGGLTKEEIEEFLKTAVKK